MARKYVYTALLLLVLITDVRTQILDFFGGFQPLISYQTTKRTTKHFYESTTKRPKTLTTKRFDFFYELTTRKPVVSFNSQEENRRTKEKPRRKTTVTPSNIYNLNFFSTTVKPLRKTTKASHRITENYNSGDNSRTSKQKDSRGSNSRLEYGIDDAQRWLEKPNVNNIADDYYTTRPDYAVTNKPNYYNNYEDSRPNTNYENSRPNTHYENSKPNYHNEYTTKNPFYNRPGVKPAVIDNRPPITNRPVTNRPVTNKPTTRRTTYVVPARPTDPGAIAFPDEDITPSVVSGPDEDYMSDAEKRRYIDLAERMCDKYKSLTTKKVAAIPLLPSPVPVQVDVDTCVPTDVPLIIGGKVVSIRDFPHMALLGWEKLDGGGYSWKCGGSLVSDQYVLTAAHCAYQERDNTVISGPPRVVQLGSSYMDDSGALTVRVSTVIRHPKYKASRSYYDIALLKLASPVTFSEVIKPACLGVPPQVNQHIIATGWGQTQVGGDQSQELRSVSLPVWDIASCARILGTSRKMPEGPSSDSQMCAGEPRGGRDTCQGDSGGPAMTQDGCVWRVVAVTSVGRSCAAPNTPGLYSIVHRAFVASVVFGGQTNNRKNHNNNNNRRTDNSGSYDYNPQPNNNQDYNNHNSNNNGNYEYNNQNNNNHRTDNSGNNHRSDNSGNYDGNQSHRSDRPSNTRNVRTDGIEYGNVNNPVVSNQGNTNYRNDYNNQQNHRSDRPTNTRNVRVDGIKIDNINNPGVRNQGNTNNRNDYNQDYSNQQNNNHRANNGNPRTEYEYVNPQNHASNINKNQGNRNENYRAVPVNTGYETQQQNQRTNHNSDYNRQYNNNPGYDSSRIWFT